MPFPWSEAEASGTCLLWPGATDVDGYAYFKRKGHRSRRAHRAAYEAVNGRPPPGFVVMHTCDNPRCVAPAHLIPGTQADNIRDMIAKGRRGKPYPGSKNPEKAFTGRKLGAKNKKKAETPKALDAPVKESRPRVVHDPEGRCKGRGCTYEIGGRYPCEY